MNKKKIIILFIIIALLYALFMIIFIKNNHSAVKRPIAPTPEIPNETVDYDYLIIGDYSLWGYIQNTWKELDYNVLDEELLNTYINNQYYGQYKLTFVNSWNLINSENKFVPYTGDLIAFSPELNVSIKNYNIQEVTVQEINEINSFMNINISINDLSVNELVSIDLDDNGVMDKIVSVSNLDAFEVQEKYFNLVYIYLNDAEKILVNETVEETELLLSPIYNIKSLLNINNEASCSIVLQEGYFSDSGETNNRLYQFYNNNYIDVIN